MGYNPWNKRPAALPELTREFVLKSSGEPFKLTLRKLGTVQQMEVFELTETLVERYVTGDSEFVETKGKSGEGPIPFTPIGELRVQPNRAMISSAAMLQVMQEGPTEELLDADAWIAFQVVEETSDWIAIQKFMNEVSRIGKPSDPKAADVPNGSGADTKPSSDPPSPGTSSTPNLRLE